MTIARKYILDEVYPKFCDDYVNTLFIPVKVGANNYMKFDLKFVLF